MLKNREMQLNRKVIYIAIASAPQVLLVTNNAYAACNGTIATPNSAAITVECSGTGTTGNLNNADVTTYVDNTTTATAGSNVLLQLDGQSRAHGNPPITNCS